MPVNMPRTSRNGTGASRVISETGTTGALPGSLNANIAPTRGTPYVLKANPLTEYVAGSPTQAYAGFFRSLGFAIDDITADFASDLYDRMAFDPTIKGNTRLVKSAILSEEVSLASPVHDESEDGFGKAQDILDFCNRVLENLETPLEDVLRDMLEAFSHGNRVAEQIYEQPTSGVDNGKLVLTKLKVKPRQTTAFVVDFYRNVIGLIGYIPGVGFPVQTGSFIDPARQPNLLPREKFAVLTWEPKDGDPRGTSSLRSAYWPWQAKAQVMPQYLSYLAKFASPSLWATTGPDAQSVSTSNADGTIVDSPPALQLGAQMANFYNGSYIVLPNGARVDAIHVTGDGQAFLKAFEFFDAQMTYAMLSQTLSTGQAQHASRAQATVHQDILSLLIREGKNAVCRMIRRDILMPLVRYNFGEDAVTLTPNASLGEVESRDVAPLITALASAGYVIANSQLPSIDELIGIEQRSQEDIIEAQLVAEGGANDGSAPATPSGTSPPVTPPPGTPVATGRPALTGAQTPPRRPVVVSNRTAIVKE